MKTEKTKVFDKEVHAWKGEAIYEMSDGTFETRIYVGGPLGILNNGWKTLEEAKDFIDKNHKMKGL